jgi:hypothetical protein
MWPWVYCSIALATTVSVEVMDSNGVRVRSAAGLVHVPACRGVSWEQFNPLKGAFEAVSGPPCGPDSAAIEIDSDGAEFPMDGMLSHSGVSEAVTVVRAVVVIGEKCRKNLPFSFSNCAVVRREYGPNLVIRTGG